MLRLLLLEGVRTLAVLVLLPAVFLAITFGRNWWQQVNDSVDNLDVKSGYSQLFLLNQPSMGKGKPHQQQHQVQAVKVNWHGASNSLLKQASKPKGVTMVRTGNDGDNMVCTSYNYEGQVVEPKSTSDNASDITTSISEAAITPTNSWHTCFSKTEQADYHNRLVKTYA